MTTDPVLPPEASPRAASDRAPGALSRAFGVVGLVLGLAAVLLTLAPFGFLFSWPLALFAILAGIMALCLPAGRVVLSSAGAVLGVLTVPVGFFVAPLLAR